MRGKELWGPCCDPPGMPARIEEILRQPSRVIGSLAFPNDGMLVVYLLQQGGQPYRTYWGYSEQLCLRVAEHNSNGPRATKYTRRRTDWLLALYIGTFPNRKDGLKIAKEGKKDAKRRLLGLESSAQHARSRSKGVRALHDNVQLAYELAARWNDRSGLELRVVIDDINFDALRDQGQEAGVGGSEMNKKKAERRRGK